MNSSEILFWSLLVLVIYTYIGYGFVLFLLTKIKSLLFASKKEQITTETPSITLVIAAYNEMEYLPSKVKNCLSLFYPQHKLKLLFVTDGSNDGSEQFLEQYKTISTFHQPQRGGKMAAINRVMPYVNSDIVIFSDANALLNPDALLNIVKHFGDPNIGCVAGEKRIQMESKGQASNAGEGFYWKYESKLKYWSSNLNSTVGAAGELFAIRTKLFEAPKADTILDDFILSLMVVSKGYKIAYAPDAYATEFGSSSIKEEMKRKIRICTGGVQAIRRTLPLLNPVKYPLFAFQYLSHRCLRWTITPIALLSLIPFNAFLAITQGNVYTTLGILHLGFYFLAIFGWFLKEKEIELKLLFIPFYFIMMNVSALLGIKRYLFNEQSILWEKSARLTLS